MGRIDEILDGLQPGPGRLAIPWHLVYVCDREHEMVAWARSYGRHCWVCGRFGRKGPPSVDHRV